MFRELLIFPLFAALCLGFTVQLVEIAESTSGKAIDFTNDMHGALDCATRGIDMKECSPDLFTYEFDDEIEKTIDSSLEFSRELEDSLARGEDYNIKREGNKIIIEKLEND